MNDEINNFIKEYRDSLDKQYKDEMRNIENEKRLQFQNIASSANRLGTLYSNFPQRTRTQYLTNTYTPAISNAYNTYQTGMQKLRENVIGQMNNLANINEEIAILNDTNKTPKIGNYDLTEEIPAKERIQMNISKPYLVGDRTHFSGLTGDEDTITYGEWAKRLGAESSDDYIAGINVLTDDEQKTFNSAWKKAQQKGYTGVGLNEGTADYDAYDWLDPQERFLLKSLGLDYSK